MANQSYTNIYNTFIQKKQMLRNSISIDQITNNTRHAWDVEDQIDANKLHYYQALEKKRLDNFESEDFIQDIKFVSEVRVKR